jgi:hypothetical protein
MDKYGVCGYIVFCLFLTKPILTKGITAAEISYTMKPTFNDPQFKVLPNLMLNFKDNQLSIKSSAFNIFPSLVFKPACHQRNSKLKFYYICGVT